jgi:hypothetical protein
MCGADGCEERLVEAKDIGVVIEMPNGGALYQRIVSDGSIDH